MKIEVVAYPRTQQGTGASRRLRQAGRVPGIVYGGDRSPMNIELDHKDLFFNLRNEKFHASILSLDVEGAKEQVLLRAVNMHPFKLQVQHVDFQRVSKDRKIHMKVPLHFVNAEKSPAGKSAGVVITHELNEVTVSCLPKDLPEAIEVDLSELAVGDVIHLSALKLPAGVEIPELKLGPDHDLAVVIAKHARVEEEAPAAEGDEEKK